MKTFKIGLCMAGAVSAGAYTAGVIDYLMEALDDWEKRKAAGEANVPNHQVEIPVIGGASAGGITGFLLASQLQRAFKPLKTLNGDLKGEHPENLFYHTWVDLTKDDILKRLLNTDDLKKGEINSLLNAVFIEEVAQRALTAQSQNLINRPYFSAVVKLFATLTNSNGFEYKIYFEEDDHQQGSYRMKQHADTVTFAVNQTEYKGDGWIPLDFVSGKNLKVAREAAMSTAAFPIGLKARTITREKKHVLDNVWLQPFFDKNITEELNAPYKNLNIDGGTINNEPFEKVRELLNKITGENEEKFNEHNTFESTMLMIDPFPGDEENPTTDQSPPSSTNPLNTDLRILIPSILSTLLNQLRAKTTELKNAMDKTKAGAYLIAPCRFEQQNGNEIRIRGAKALASGALGGFSGFLKKEFRIHDFFLGRANCERFLREHFTLPEGCENPIFIDGYQNVSNPDHFKNSKGELQIIPIFTHEKNDGMYMPDFGNGKNWPSVPKGHFDSYGNAVKKRATLIIKTLTANSGFWIKVYRNLGLFAGSGALKKAIVNSIEEKLKCHQLIEKS